MSTVAPKRPIALWGRNRHTALAALVLMHRHATSLCLVDEDTAARGPWLESVPSVSADRLANDARVLHSAVGKSPPPSMSSEAFDLDLASEDALKVEMRRLSLVQLHSVAHQLHGWGFSLEAQFVDGVIFDLFNSRVPAAAIIGEGTTFGYGGIGVVIHKGSVIGRNVKIGQNVTLGSRAGGAGLPVIGDDVYIGPNSVCLGGSVGDGAVIGAGSVVLHPVAAGAVVAGNPARTIRSGPKP